MLGFDAAKVDVKINNFCRFSLFDIGRINKIHIVFH